MALNWLQLVLGLWVVISPWLLGFSNNDIALWSNIIAGISIVILSLWSIFDKESLD